MYITIARRNESAPMTPEAWRAMQDHAIRTNGSVLNRSRVAVVVTRIARKAGAPVAAWCMYRGSIGLWIGQRFALIDFRPIGKDGHTAKDGRRIKIS